MEIFALAPLSSPLQGPGRHGRSRKFGRGTGDRKNFCWGAVDFSSKKDQDQDATDGHENLTEASGTEQNFAGAPLTSPLQGPRPGRRPGPSPGAKSQREGKSLPLA